MDKCLCCKFHRMFLYFGDKLCICCTRQMMQQQEQQQQVLVAGAVENPLQQLHSSHCSVSRFPTDLQHMEKPTEKPGSWGFLFSAFCNLFCINMSELFTAISSILYARPVHMASAQSFFWKWTLPNSHPACQLPLFWHFRLESTHVFLFLFHFCSLRRVKSLAWSLVLYCFWIDRWLFGLRKRADGCEGMLTLHVFKKQDKKGTVREN